MSLVIPVFISHRGCPHQCLFCNQHVISGSDKEKKAGCSTDNEKVTETIEQWLARSPGRDNVQVAFYGGSFTCLPFPEQERLLSSVQPFITDGRVDSIRLSTRPDCVTEDIVSFLYESGVRTVELGVQSLDDNVLQKSLRGHSAEDSLQAMNILRQQGLQVGVQLLPGLPGETTNSFFNTVSRIVTFQPDFVRIYPAVVVEKSELANMYREGIYKPLSLNKAIALTYAVYEKFSNASIPVVRMGLQPSDSLAEQIVAGPYHPAFGELVISRLWFKRLRKKLSSLEAGKKLEIHISNRDVSAVVGMKKMNSRRLESLGFKDRFRIVPDKDRERGSVEYVVS